MRNMIQYEHHGVVVWVQRDLMGRHREHCLCEECKKLVQGGKRKKQCPIASNLYDLCCRNHIVAPVWECPEFVRNR